MTNYDTVIFDLDGTLLDTAPGIFSSLYLTEEELGLRHITPEEQRALIGPPLEETFAKYYSLTTKAAISRVVKTYYKHYSSDGGLGNSILYPGMRELLTRLKEGGLRLGVATMKEELYARKNLAPHGLGLFFGAMVCYDKETRPTKGQLILRAMKLLGSGDPSSVLMVGDSRFDGVGAAEAGVDFAAVTYGYGFSASGAMEGVTPVALAADVPALEAYISKHTAAPLTI